MFHDYSGFIVLILAFTFLFNFARILKCERFLGIPLNDEMEKRDAEAAKAARDRRGNVRAASQAQHDCGVSRNAAEGMADPAGLAAQQRPTPPHPAENTGP